jgi:UBX domain-containing protein 1/4
MEEQQ